MTCSAKLTVESDMMFAHDLTRANMVGYYATHGRVWDQSFFIASWPQTENYALFESNNRVGILRLSQTDVALWIRDLQVLPASQNKGTGSFGISFALRLAAKRDKSVVWSIDVEALFSESEAMRMNIGLQEYLKKFSKYGGET